MRSSMVLLQPKDPAGVQAGRGRSASLRRKGRRRSRGRCRGRRAGTEDGLALLRNPDKEALVEAITANLGMRRVDFVFTHAFGRTGKGECTLSVREVLQAAELHAEGGIKEWVTVLVKLEVNEDGAADVHFEAFKMSDVCVKLFEEGWFVARRRINEREGAEKKEEKEQRRRKRRGEGEKKDTKKPKEENVQNLSCRQNKREGILNAWREIEIGLPG